ncbi:MAG TPA: hypothetical protein VNK96_01215 [Fimbriimonadales bacterium]|nr:hypothetical protein [Fimbriimonadales bacterium]
MVNVRLKASELRRVNTIICDIIAQRPQELSWLRDTSTPADSVPDDAIVGIRTHEENVVFLGAFLPLVTFWQKVHDDIRDAAARQIALSLPRVANPTPNEIDISSRSSEPTRYNLQQAFGAIYSSIIFCWLSKAGYTCEFIPPGKSKSPDILVKNDNLLIECKDTLSEVKGTEDLLRLKRKLYKILKEAQQQLDSYDPKMEHIVFLDLPWGGFELLYNLPKEEADLFWLKVLNLRRVLVPKGVCTPRSTLRNAQGLFVTAFGIKPLKNDDGSISFRGSAWLKPITSPFFDNPSNVMNQKLKRAWD